MRRIIMLAAALFLTVSLWAGDPWKDKSYQDWDEKDVHKIMNDSPWATKIEIESDKKEHGGLEAPEGAPTAAGAGGEKEEEDEKEGSGGEKDEAKEKGDVTFIVRWISSRTLREASARGAVLQGRILQADIEKHLPPEPDDYELVVAGSDMSMFQKAEESTLKDKSNLSARKSRQRISPNRVEILRTTDGKKIIAILFHFPKKTQAGEPLIANDEKELKFVSRTGAGEIKAGFDPQKMVDRQGRDL
ncbi:MAG: hypothetical protein WBC04_08720 [Candidatus Acidiferrales bacterium]